MCDVPSPLEVEVDRKRYIELTNVANEIVSLMENHKVTLDERCLIRDIANKMSENFKVTKK